MFESVFINSIPARVGLRTGDSSPAVHVFNPKGESLGEYCQVKRQGSNRATDKNRLPNPKRALVASSPDDRFVAIYGCGESNKTVGDGEVGIFEVERDSSGATKGLKLFFVLAGHTSDVLCLAWNSTGNAPICVSSMWPFTSTFKFI